MIRRAAVTIAFVDLFACALGGVIQLWAVFLADAQPVSGMSGKTTIVTITVLPGEGKDYFRALHGDHLPAIGLSGEWADHRLIPPLEAGAYEGKSLQFPSGGRTTRTAGTINVMVIGDDFAKEDRLFIFLADLQALALSHEAKIPLQVSTQGPPRDPLKFTLSMSNPCVAFSLQEIVDKERLTLSPPVEAQ